MSECILIDFRKLLKYIPVGDGYIVAVGFNFMNKV